MECAPRCFAGLHKICRRMRRGARIKCKLRLSGVRLSLLDLQLDQVLRRMTTRRETKRWVAGERSHWASCKSIQFNQPWWRPQKENKVRGGNNVQPRSRIWKGKSRLSSLSCAQVQIDFYYWCCQWVPNPLFYFYATCAVLNLICLHTIPFDGKLHSKNIQSHMNSA